MAYVGALPNPAGAAGPGDITLPAPWASRDIGAVGAAGTASHSSDVFTVRGSGANISGGSDAFHYAFRPMSGDGVIVARVATVQKINGGTKAGVMIRESLTPGSKHAMISVSSGAGISSQTRTTTGGGTSFASGASVKAPYWVRLDRRGSTIIASQSSNGSAWTTVDTRTIAMAATVYAGLPVTSHDKLKLSTATFDNVSLSTRIGDTTAPAVAITAPTEGASVSGTAAVAADASDAVGVTKVEFLLDGEVVHADTSAPHAFSWDTSSAVSDGPHALVAKAYDAAGNTGSSAPVTVIVEPGPVSPPSPPADLTAALLSASEVQLSWTASAGPAAVAGYNVLRNGIKIATSTTTRFLDAVTPSTYRYSVAAFDATGNTSGPSNDVTILVPGNNEPGGMVWSMANSSLQNVRNVSDTYAQRHFDNPASFVTGPSDGTQYQVPTGWSMTAVANYKSYAAFRADLDAGGRIDSRIKWVKYNPEKWDLTPPNEQENPGYYMQVFCQAAHANGYKCITAPARSLLLVTSAVCHIDYSIDDNLNDAYLRCRTAEQAARYSDQFGIQGQVNQGDPTKYRDFVSRASAQAKAANGNVQVIANLTTNLQDVNQSSCTLYNASTAVEDIVAGHWLHVDGGTGNIAVNLLKNIEAGACVSSP